MKNLDYNIEEGADCGRFPMLALTQLGCANTVLDIKLLG